MKLFILILFVFLNYNPLFCKDIYKGNSNKYIIHFKNKKVYFTSKLKLEQLKEIFDLLFGFVDAQIRHRKYYNSFGTKEMLLNNHLIGRKLYGKYNSVYSNHRYYFTHVFLWDNYKWTSEIKTKNVFSNYFTILYPNDLKIFFIADKKGILYYCNSFPSKLDLKKNNLREFENIKELGYVWQIGKVVISKN